jgi:hypothetical protein
MPPLPADGHVAVGCSGYFDVIQFPPKPTPLPSKQRTLHPHVVHCNLSKGGHRPDTSRECHDDPKCSDGDACAAALTCLRWPAKTENSQRGERKTTGEKTELLPSLKSENPQGSALAGSD